MADGGIHLVHDDASVEAAALFAEVEAGAELAAVAVGHRAVAQADHPGVHPALQPGRHPLPQGDGVGGLAVGGVQHHQVGLLPHRRRVRQQPRHQFGGAGGVGAETVGVPQHGPDVEILQRAGGLDQRRAHEGTARLIGGKHQLPGSSLGIQLTVAVHQHRAAAALKELRILPDGGQHGVPAQIHAAVQKGEGKQHPLSPQGPQPVGTLYLYTGPPLQRMGQHRRQAEIFFDLRANDR